MHGRWQLSDFLARHSGTPEHSSGDYSGVPGIEHNAPPVLRSTRERACGLTFTTPELRENQVPHPAQIPPEYRSSGGKIGASFGGASTRENRKEGHADSPPEVRYSGGLSALLVMTFRGDDW